MPETRRDFLKATGSLVVGFSAAGTLAAQTARGTVSGPPNDAEVDSYIAVHPDNTVTIFSGYVELGQGGPTALRQIAAEELDLDFDQVATVGSDTFVSTSGATYASMTVAVGGVKLRAAAAEARRVLLTLASERLKTPAESLIVARGVVSVKGEAQKSVTYGDLLGDKAFNHKFEPVSYRAVGVEVPRTNPNNAPQKPRAEYKIVGSRVRRFDMPDKVSGKYTYMQHVRVPGMLHGRVVWPRGQGAYGMSLPRVIGIDEASIRGIPGVRIVRRGNFVGVAAERQWDAVRAARNLKVTWEAFAPLPGSEGLHDHFRAAKTKDLVVANIGDVDTSLREAVHVASGTYIGPYQSHGTMAPNCAIADVTENGALVMCSDQEIYQGRAGLAQVLGLPAGKIRVQYYLEGTRKARPRSVQPGG
jgi:nicotinate dehydrogenase subunit B